MAKMKEILYAPSGSKMYEYYCEFKQKYYDNYPQLGKHFKHLWERHCFGHSHSVLNFICMATTRTIILREALVFSKI
jgi:hypothetical protein